MQLSATAITALLMVAGVGGLAETAPAPHSGPGVISVTSGPQTLRDVANGGVKPGDGRAMRPAV